MDRIIVPLLLIGVLSVAVHCIPAKDKSTAPSDTLPGKTHIILSSGKTTNVERYNIRSANGGVIFGLNGVGDMVIQRKCDDKILWIEEIPDRSDSENITMERDGNLVLYSQNGSITWHSNTAGNPGADLRLTNEGFLCVYQNRRCVWSNGQRFTTPCGAQTTTPRPKLTTTKSQRVFNQDRIILHSGHHYNAKTFQDTSENGAVGLQFTGDGDLVITKMCGGQDTLWTLVIPYHFDAELLYLESDGDLLIKGPNGTVYWRSNTGGNPGADLRLGDNGLLCLYKDGACIWSNGRQFADVPCQTKTRSTTPAQTPQKRTTTEYSEFALISGQTLTAPYKLASPNGKVVFGIDSDGDLIIVRMCDEALLWKKVLSGVGKSVTMEEDGNLVVVSAMDGTVLFESETDGNPGAVLRLEDNGHLCVFKDDRCIWSNGERFVTNCALDADEH